MDTPKIPEKSPLHLKLCKHKQLQGIHKIKLIAKEKMIEIGAKMVKQEVHNADKGEMQAETGKMVKIRPWSIRLST